MINLIKYINKLSVGQKVMSLIVVELISFSLVTSNAVHQIDIVGQEVERMSDFYLPTFSSVQNIQAHILGERQNFQGVINVGEQVVFDKGAKTQYQTYRKQYEEESKEISVHIAEVKVLIRSISDSSQGDEGSFSAEFTQVSAILEEIVVSNRAHKELADTMFQHVEDGSFLMGKELLDELDKKESTLVLNVDKLLSQLTEIKSNSVLYAQKVQEDAKTFTIAIAVITIICGISIIFLVVKRNISRPLYQLTSTIDEFDVFKALHESDVEKALMDRGDELGMVARSFNRMKKQLIETRQQLVAERETLEERVAERTMALHKQTQTVQLLHETAVAANQAQDTKEALKTCLDAVCRYTGWPIGHVYQRLSNDPDTLVSTDIWHLSEPERFDAFRQGSREINLRRGIGLPGRVLVSGKPHWIANVTIDPNFLRAAVATDVGVKSGFAAPVLVGNEVVAMMEFFTTEEMEEDESLLSVLDNIGTQIGRVVERKQTEEIINKAHNLITESVEYASNIQRSLLPPPTRLDAALGDYFVLWEPRDIVGGDFYWLRSCHDGHLLIVGDCTGHGVPGAFMTLIATGALDFAMSREPGGDPATILAHMNQFTRRTLAQDTDYGHADDGLELGVCRINDDGEGLTYAGARFSLVISDIYGIREIKGDKTGIGYRRSDPNYDFTNQHLDVSPDMSFYLYSDGIVDQVGGERRRGFGRKRLLQLLTDSQDRPMAEQKKKIQDSFHDFQGDELRRDDVTLVGFKTS